MFTGAHRRLVDEHRHAALVSPWAAGLNPTDGTMVLVSTLLPPEIDAADHRLLDEPAIDHVRQLIIATAVAANINDDALGVLECFQGLVKLLRDGVVRPARDADVTHRVA